MKLFSTELNYIFFKLCNSVHFMKPWLAYIKVNDQILLVYSLY